MPQNLIDTMEIVLAAATLLILISGIIGLYLHKKQIYFTTIRKCIEDYRKIVRGQQFCEENHTDEKIDPNYIYILDHLGLVNEELFYMKMGYLPRNISLDWLKNMMMYIPIYRKGDTEKPINESLIFKSAELKKYCQKPNANDSRKCYLYLEKVKQFSMIKKSFIISDKFYDSLTKPYHKDLYSEIELDFSDEDIKSKLAIYIWKKIKKERRWMIF